MIGERKRDLYHRIIVGVGLSLLLSGCFQGYKPADELADDERGPAACATSCQELGMYMSAFVLVDRDTSGCVCSPMQGPRAPQAELDATGAAAAYAMIEAQRQAQQHQAAQAPPPH